MVSKVAQIESFAERRASREMTALLARVPRTANRYRDGRLEQVDLASVPYLTFIANKKAGGEAASYSFVLRGYVRHWLGNVWAEYDRIKLTDLVKAQAGDAPRPKVQAAS